MCSVYMRALFLIGWDTPPPRIFGIFPGGYPCSNFFIFFYFVVEYQIRISSKYSDNSFHIFHVVFIVCIMVCIGCFFILSVIFSFCCICQPTTTPFFGYFRAVCRVFVSFPCSLSFSRIKRLRTLYFSFCALFEFYSFDIRLPLVWFRRFFLFWLHFFYVVDIFIVRVNEAHSEKRLFCFFIESFGWHPIHIVFYGVETGYVQGYAFH